MWHKPIPHHIVPTDDAESFRTFSAFETGLPIAPHPGAFGVKRKHHTHEGVDLYAQISTPVMAVEGGVVAQVDVFTGPILGQPWWNTTKAVWVDGPSGTVVYGEIIPHVKPGQHVHAGEIIGVVDKVLTKDKGRPMSMLHLELHEYGSRQAPEWTGERPSVLRDPTPFLMEAVSKKSSTWDKITGGIKAGEIFVMAAGAGVDKSKLMENQNGNV